jgi:hypothetical protein
LEGTKEDKNMQTTQTVQNADRVQKLITFSTKLYNTAVARANNLGIPFAEYIRHIVVTDIEENIENLPMVDAETNKLIGQSLKDVEEGRYMVVEPNDKEGLDKLAGLK